MTEYALCWRPRLAELWPMSVVSSAHENSENLLCGTPECLALRRQTTPTKTAPTIAMLPTVMEAIPAIRRIEVLSQQERRSQQVSHWPHSHCIDLSSPSLHSQLLRSSAPKLLRRLPLTLAEQVLLSLLWRSSEGTAPGGRRKNRIEGRASRLTSSAVVMASMFARAEDRARQTQGSTIATGTDWPQDIFMR